MNIKIEIDNRNFYINEEAYRALDDLLNKATQHLSGDDRKIIRQDIERRVADYMTAHYESTHTFQVADVCQIMEEIGVSAAKPEDFNFEGEQTSCDTEEKERTDTTYLHSKPQKSMVERSLSRSNRDKLIGGVCGGIGEWAGVSSVIVRLIMIWAAIYGVGIVAYLLLWIVMPKSVDVAELSSAGTKDGGGCSKGCLIVLLLGSLVFMPLIMIFIFILSFWAGFSFI